jgi:hypothetical protein
MRLLKQTFMIYRRSASPQYKYKLACEFCFICYLFCGAPRQYPAAAILFDILQLLTSDLNIATSSLYPVIL